ncbi:hypothetical protein F6X68_10310 [Micromonospora sp. AMSO12t]|uniref:hypothetical protein n=1 Tax=Micromonospora sp. AMSO12t TaxID=2650410 RepID=UPI00124B554E|nr:hypothetical protein [Micromonospora sp. AMSO12t]KAB1158769.1 hypothetical protein F6X68_10310 [Micromonospora sp. AMSO12t]
MKAGDVLHLTRAASPQFARPIFFRLIKVRAELHTYDGWTWIDGYQLDEKGDAIARRELFVLKAGVRAQLPPPRTRPKVPARQALRRR